MAEDEKEKGFTIRDKRHFVEGKEDEDQDGQQPEQEAEGKNRRPQPLPYGLGTESRAYQHFSTQTCNRFSTVATDFSIA